MDWVEMHFQELDKKIVYLADADYADTSKLRLGWEIDKKVQDYIQRKMFWCRAEALEKYSAFDTVWDLIEDVVYEFAKKHSDRIWITDEDKELEHCDKCKSVVPDDADVCPGIGCDAKFPEASFDE